MHGTGDLTASGFQRRRIALSATLLVVTLGEKVRRLVLLAHAPSVFTPSSSSCG